MIKRHKKGFTLAELLIALGIIGTIAAMTIPNLLSNIHNKMLVTQLKNNVVSIQNLIGNQLALNRTKNLTDTDFKSADDLFTDSNFNYTKICEATTAQKDCWKTITGNSEEEDQTANAKVKYRFMDNSSALPAARKTIVLSNGVIFSYEPANGATTKEVDGETVEVAATDITIDMDVNGTDGPNIVGRDFFSFKIKNDGTIYGGYEDEDAPSCSTNAFACFSSLLQNNWKMTY